MSTQFERLAEREVRWSRRHDRFRSRREVFGLVVRVWWAIVALWAVLLAVHWMVADEPRWLVVLHTVLYGIVVASSVVAALVARSYLRTEPDELDDPGVEPSDADVHAGG